MLRTAARRGLFSALTLAAGLALAACAITEEGESVCPEQGSGAASWPYCAPAEPGGHQPADFPDLP